MIQNTAYVCDGVLFMVIAGRFGYEQTRGGQWVATLSKNSRAHHMAKHRVKKRDEDGVLAMTRTLSPRCEMFKNPHVRFDFYMTGHPRRDYDNQVGLIKGAQDGLVAAGVIADDSMAVMGKAEVNVIEDAENFCIITVAERESTE